METLFIGKNIIKLNEVDSTNSYANGLLKHNRLTEGTIVISNHQTQGRGQRGNSWNSLPGCNLTFSLILYPNFLNAKTQFFLSKITALAIADSLACLCNDDLSKQEIKVKWPNDILLNGKKIAGILIENQFQHNSLQNSVIGIGININQKHFPDQLNHASSLIIETNKFFELSAILSSFCSFFEPWYLKLRSGNLDLISDAYLNYLYGLNNLISFLYDDKKCEGRIIGVDLNGELKIELENGMVRNFEIKQIKILY